MTLEHKDNHVNANALALLQAAKAVSNFAYSPYSKFRVGAALEGLGGQVFVGTNFENASYGATICAERCAIGNAVSSGCIKFQAIAVVSSGDEAATPCGICRQCLAEFNPKLQIFCSSIKLLAKGDFISYTLDQLLPASFLKF